MNDPLVGDVKKNYFLFYGASISVILSMLMLFTLTGYTAYISTSASELISNMNNVVDELGEILPETEQSLNILKAICRHENFSKWHGFECNFK